MPSSVIRAWSYDEADARLDVTFVSGKRYSYHGVPEQVAQGMRNALSRGRYFNREIRDNFAFTEHGRRTTRAD